MTETAAVRPTRRRAAVIALGAGTPVVFLALLLSLAVADGSYRSLVGAVVAYLLAWLRASRVSVVAEKDRLIVHNFYGSAVIARHAVERVEPFSYWVNPNFTCLAIRTESKRKPMHATALPDGQTRYEAEARSVAARLGLPLHGV